MQFTAGRKVRASELNYDTENGVDCHYRALTSQNLPSVASTPLAFGTAIRTSPLITQGTQGAGHRFTVSRAGLWSVSTSCWIAAGGTVGFRFIGLNHAGSGALLFEQGMQVTNTQGLSLAIGTTVYLAANDAVYVTLYSDGGSTQATAAGLDRVSFRMAWTHD